MWFVESPTIGKGGEVYYDKSFRLKNLASNLYLTMRGSGISNDDEPFFLRLSK